MAELQRLRNDHAASVLAFEQANRAYFARFITDRGDAYFQTYAERHRALMADQAAGVGAYYVLVAEDSSVLGRFNLTFLDAGIATLGYRVAETAAGHGVATAAVRELCQLAAARHGVRLVRAAVSDLNVASQRVLVKAGFSPVGPADPNDIGGNIGAWYERRLVVDT
jgi:ribosomal-protein-alanine N-acetyltransferase